MYLFRAGSAALLASVIFLVSASAAHGGTDTITHLAGRQGSIVAPQPALQIGLQLPEGVAA